MVVHEVVMESVIVIVWVVMVLVKEVAEIVAIECVLIAVITHVKALVKTDAPEVIISKNYNIMFLNLIFLLSTQDEPWYSAALRGFVIGAIFIIIPAVIKKIKENKRKYN